MFYAEKKDGICKRPIARIGGAPQALRSNGAGRGPAEPRKAGFETNCRKLKAGGTVEDGSSLRIRI